MQPIAAPVIPLVANATPDLATPDCSVPLADGQATTGLPMAQADGTSLFAQLLAPLATTEGQVLAENPTLPTLIPSPVESGLADLMPAPAKGSAEDAKDGELLALLALLGSTTPPPLAVSPSPEAAADTGMGTEAETPSIVTPSPTSGLADPGLVAPLTPTSLDLTAVVESDSPVVAATPSPRNAAPTLAKASGEVAADPPGEAPAAPVLAQAQLATPRPLVTRAASRPVTPTPDLGGTSTDASVVEATATPRASPSATTAGILAAPPDGSLEPVIARPEPLTTAPGDSAGAMPLAATVLPAPAVPAAAPAAAPPTVASATPTGGPRPLPNAVTAPTAKAVAAEAHLIEQVGTPSPETAQSSAVAAVTAPTPPRTEPLAAAPATTPATSRPEPNPLDRAVAHQVSRAVLQHLPDGGTRLVMRLTPPELGTVRVEFISRDGMMTARLMAEDEGVRQALDRALPHIRAEVRSDHPAISITVDRSDQRQGWGEGQARQERRDEQGPGQGRQRRDDDEPAFSIDGIEAAPAALPARAAPTLGGRVTRATVDAFA